MPETITAIVIDGDQATRRATSRLLISGGIDSVCHPDMKSFRREKPLEGAVVLVVDIDSAHGRLKADYEKIGLGNDLPPTIYLSSWLSDSRTVEAKRAGVVACFHKPVDGQALLDAVRFAASGSEMRADP